MDRHSEEPKNELPPRRPCESGNDSVAEVNGVEKKKIRLEQAMFERNEVEDGLEKRRLEKEQLLVKMKMLDQQAIERRNELNREIEEARESLLEDGEGIVGEPNSLSLMLHQSDPDLGDGSSDCEEKPYQISFKNLEFSSALNVMRIMGQTIALEDLSIDKFCHLSESDRSLLLEMAIRMNCVSHFIQCYGAAMRICDSEKNTGPIPFSLLRPMIERGEGTVKHKCPVQVTIEELDFIHENVMKQMQNEGVIIRVIDANFADEYRNHLKETAGPTDKVFTLTHCGLLHCQELVGVRICTDYGYYWDGVHYEDDKAGQMHASITQVEWRGHVKTIDYEFKRKSKYDTDELARTHQTL